MPIDPLAAIGMGVGALQAGISAFGIPAAAKKAEKSVEDISTYTADPEVKKILQMRAARLGMGLGATTRAIAQQGIGTAAAGATKSALTMGKGAGLGTIGAIQKQSAKQYQQLALEEEQAQERSRALYERAAAAATAERARQFQSEQEKQQLKANIALEKLASRRASLAQGLSGITGAATAGLYGRYGLGKSQKGGTSTSGMSDVEQLSARY